MAEQLTKLPRFMFFLTKDGRLPKWYPRIATLLSRSDIDLLPVTLDQLKSLSGEFDKITMLYVETTMQDKSWFRRINKGFISNLFRFKKLTFFHLSSFKTLEDYSIYKREKSYNYLALPRSFNEIISYIIMVYEQHNTVSLRWPGGSRGRLPKSVGE